MSKPKIWGVLLASVAISALGFLGACEEDYAAAPAPDQAIYATYEQCLIDNPADTCARALAEARRQQTLTAPHYAALNQCEVLYGASHCVSDGGGSFYPMMMGFMLGQMSSSGVNHPVYYPVYYNTGGAVYTGRTVVTRVPPSVVRGGFGGSSVVHVTPDAHSGIALRPATSYSSYRSGGSYTSWSSSGARSSSFSGSSARSFGGGSTARGGFGGSSGAHGGFGGG